MFFVSLTASSESEGIQKVVLCYLTNNTVFHCLVVSDSDFKITVHDVFIDYWYEICYLLLFPGKGITLYVLKRSTSRP